VVIAHVVPRVLLVFTFVILACSDNCHPPGEQKRRQGRAVSVIGAAREARGTLTSLSTPVRSTVGASDATI
jgi:hypothetical protein